MTAANRKPHLQRVDLVFERSPIYFVTACMQDRRKLLSTAAIHETFLRFAREGPARGACQKRGRLAVHGRDLFVGISLGVMRFGGDRPPLQK